jgi:preprotein translocase subunit YajC
MSSLASIVPAASTPASSGNFFSDNALTIGLVLLLVVMVIFMVRNSRKRKRDAEELQNKFVPGAEVMTQHGIYGTLISIDEEKNEAIVETTPGTRLRVHRQTIARVIDPQDVDPAKDVVEDEPAEAPTGAPQFGERVPADDAETPADEAKPAAAPARTASTRSTAARATTARSTTARSTTARSTTARSTGTAASSTAKPRTPRKKPAEGDTAE